MIINGEDFSTLDLQQIAASAKGTIIIRNADAKPTLDCQQIGASGRGHVVLDFT